MNNQQNPYTVQTYSTRHYPTQGRTMYTTDTLNSNVINKAFNTPLAQQTWLKLANVANHQELSCLYADICQQHTQQKKWVLFINPEEASLEQLAHTHGVDISKVLCVSFKGKNKVKHLLDKHSAHLDIEQIKRVLCRGNCSAVILSNASFRDDEIAELDSCARLGKTQCVLLKNLRKNELTRHYRHSH